MALFKRQQKSGFPEVCPRQVVFRMVDRNLLREFNVEEAELDSLIAASFPDFAEADIYQEQAQTYDLNQILTGTIVRVDNEEVVVDIGYKSEGVVQRDEWDDADEQPQVGERIEVLLEEFEDSIGLIVLSKRKADRLSISASTCFCQPARSTFDGLTTLQNTSDTKLSA